MFPHLTQDFSLGTTNTGSQSPNGNHGRRKRTSRSNHRCAAPKTSGNYHWIRAPTIIPAVSNPSSSIPAPQSVCHGAVQLPLPRNSSTALKRQAISSYESAVDSAHLVLTSFPPISTTSEILTQVTLNTLVTSRISTVRYLTTKALSNPLLLAALIFRVCSTTLELVLSSLQIESLM